MRGGTGDRSGAALDVQGHRQDGGRLDAAQLHRLLPGQRGVVHRLELGVGRVPAPRVVLDGVDLLLGLLGGLVSGVGTGTRERPNTAWGSPWPRRCGAGDGCLAEKREQSAGMCHASSHMSGIRTVAAKVFTSLREMSPPERGRMFRHLTCRGRRPPGGRGKPPAPAADRPRHGPVHRHQISRPQGTWSGEPLGPGQGWALWFDGHRLPERPGPSVTVDALRRPAPPGPSAGRPMAEWLWLMFPIPVPVREGKNGSSLRAWMRGGAGNESGTTPSIQVRRFSRFTSDTTGLGVRPYLRNA